jgi:hypothetical protein
VSDDEAVIARALGFECVADRLRGAAEFRERMEKVVGWVEPVTSNLTPGDAEASSSACKRLI